MKTDKEIITEALKMRNIPKDIRVNLLLCKNVFKIQREECIREIERIEKNLSKDGYTENETNRILDILYEIKQKLSKGDEK